MQKENLENKMNLTQVKTLLQTLADLIGEQKGLKLQLEIKKKK